MFCRFGKTLLSLQCHSKCRYTIQSLSGLFVPGCDCSSWQGSQAFPSAIFCAPATALVETTGALTPKMKYSESREYYFRLIHLEISHCLAVLLCSCHIGFHGKWKASLDVLRFPFIYLRFPPEFLLSHPLPLAET